MLKAEWRLKLRGGAAGWDGWAGRELAQLRIPMLTRGGVGGRWVRGAARAEEGAGRICSESSKDCLEQVKHTPRPTNPPTNEEWRLEQ